VGISENRRNRAETPRIVSTSRPTRRRPLDAEQHRRPLRVKATQFPRRQFLHLAAGAAALPAVSRVARAQAYPTRPITLIVPFAAGSGTDLVARVMAERMRASLGQSIIVENVSGADGSVGTGRAARVPPSRPCRVGSSGPKPPALGGCKVEACAHGSNGVLGISRAPLSRLLRDPG
jgi:hypothetical protein